MTGVMQSSTIPPVEPVGQVCSAQRQLSTVKPLLPDEKSNSLQDSNQELPDSNNSVVELVKDDEAIVVEISMPKTPKTSKLDSPVPSVL